VAVGGYVVAALIWPAGVALYRWKGWAPVGALAAAVVCSTVLLRGDSPTLAMLIAGAAFLAVLQFGRPAILALATASTTYWLWTPVIVVMLQKIGVWGRVYGHLPASWNRRMEIWSFTDQKIFEKPFVGWGIDASRTFKGYIQLHPHDGALQAWFELGLPGAALIAAFFLFLFWRISEAVEERLFAAAACATAVVYLVIGAISFSLWQEWWICLGALGMASAVALRRALQPPAGAPA
jgi:O-antigen ligase